MSPNPRKRSNLSLRVLVVQSEKRSVGKHSDGFALIASLSIMAVLVLIGVALFSLASVATRSAEIASAQVEAQANAKVALMQALGQLQESMGPDQRISANASILDTPQDNPDDEVMDVINPHWVGVWDSWIAGDINDAAVDSAVYPSEPSEHQTIRNPADAALKTGMAPAYAQKNAHFRKWLVSLDPTDQEDSTQASSLPSDGDPSPEAASTAVRMVGNGSLGSDAVDADFVSAGLLEIEGTSSSASGRYGWWVGDESQKARIMDDSYEEGTLTLAERISRSQAPASMGTKTITGLENIQDDTRLASLPSLATMDLVTGAVDRPSQVNFHHVTPYSYQVLSDVREGGLKRDLSALLEREISLGETGDEFMLYRFDTDGEARVPIQDLSAYYQLYYNDPNWDDGRRGGVDYDPGNSSLGTFHVKVPDYGSKDEREKYLRQYASIYTSPVPIKVEFVLGYGASEITDGERQNTEKPGRPGHPPIRLRDSDTHKLLLGLVPVVTLWNPNNVPMVIEQGNPLLFKFGIPPFAFRFLKYRPVLDPGESQAREEFEGGYLNLNSVLNNDNRGVLVNQNYPYILQFKFGETESITFEPGETKVFSVPPDAVTNGGLLSTLNIFEPTNELYLDSYVTTYHAATNEEKDRWREDVFDFAGDGTGFHIVFKPSDKITVEIVPEQEAVESGRGTNSRDNAGTEFSKNSEIRGGALNMWLAGYEHVKHGHLAPAAAKEDKTYHFRNYQMISRTGRNSNNIEFNNELMSLGFPVNEESDADPPPLLETIPFAPLSGVGTISGSDIIEGPNNNEPNYKAFLYFSLAAACEANSENTTYDGHGRRAATRPFLHGSTIAAPIIDQVDKSALYNIGWDWKVMRITSARSPIQTDMGNGYYGGGHASGEGTTHVIQQYLPVLPPISIASLSNAHLGGFSLANQPTSLGRDDDVYLAKEGEFSADLFRRGEGDNDFQQVTATGSAGLAPHIMQAIGNSYAHPNIPADQASTTYTRELNATQPEKIIPFVDHSYLANKALWDEFFFSSMTPQPYSEDNPTVFGNDRGLASVAKQFFHFEGSESIPLPNRRMTPYTRGFDKEKLDALIGQADEYTDGLADKIAAHLMVEGPFNVNSTSVEAWKVLLSSLQGKPISYLNDGEVSEQTPDGTPMNSGMLANAELVKSEEIEDYNIPAEQWKAGREITRSEIEELAAAIVKQVKLRGPFLSLSDFVNRRLESSSSPLALKGALQAALDDPSVSINAHFRTPERTLDSEVGDGSDFEFPDAAKGPIAYGSTAYVDQADVLQHFAEQLTPRGDTFVIRSYGDTLDENGKVLARAWCEAVVQRMPDYIHPADEPHLKQADSSLSGVSKTFGRKIEMISFRWLNPDEV